MSGSYKQSQPAAVSSGILPGGSLPQQGILAQQAANNPFAVQTNPSNPSKGKINLCRTWEL